MEEFEIESGDLFNIKAQEEDFDLPEEHVYDLLDLTSPSIFFILVIALLISVMVLLGQLFYLTVIKGSYYIGQARDVRIRTYKISAPRGEILDRYGNPIAYNIPQFSVEIIPLSIAHEKDSKKLISSMVHDFKIKKQILADLVESKDPPGDYVTIKEGISRQDAIILQSKYSGKSFLRVSIIPKRTYKYPSIFSHVIGYISSLNVSEWPKYKNAGYAFDAKIGRVGLEGIYESELKGQNGKQQVTVDARGYIEKQLAQIEPISGELLTTTLDSLLSKKSYDVFMSKAKGLAGAIIALDPNNGEVLTFLSFPDFDSNKVNTGQKNYIQKLFKDKNNPFLNRPVAGQYPPGSTIKPFIASLALQEKIIDQNTTIIDQGSIRVPNVYDPNIIYRFFGWNRNGLGPMNVVKALGWSSDIFFYTVGGGYGDFSGLGIKRLAEGLEKFFNFGESTGINFPNEASGLIPTLEWKNEAKKEPWYVGDTYNISIGQGDLTVSPLQLLT